MKTELKNIGAWGRMHYDFLLPQQSDGHQCYAAKRNPKQLPCRH